MGDSLNETEIEEIEQIFVSADVNGVSHLFFSSKIWLVWLVCYKYVRV